MNTQGLIITTTMDWALGEEEVGKYPPFIIPEELVRQFYTQNKAPAKKKLTKGNNIRLLLCFYFLKINLKVPNF